MFAIRALLFVVSFACCAHAQETGLDLCSLFDMGNRPLAAKEEAPPVILDLLVSKAGLQAEDFQLFAWSLPPVKGMHTRSTAPGSGRIPSSTIRRSSQVPRIVRRRLVRQVRFRARSRAPYQKSFPRTAQALARQRSGGGRMGRLGNGEDWRPVEQVMAAIDRLQSSNFCHC